MAGRADFQTAVDQFSDWRWRLNNLYWITDKGGKRVKFEMNWAQMTFFEQMHYLNVLLKARQLGLTTFIQIFMLDACVFNRDIRAGTIAHTLGDAQTIFRDKVKYPYDNLPDGIRAAVPIIRDNTSELLLGNNSSIRVGTSLRSGTLQYLHISEYGKLCAKYPEKAREVRTGALNTVQAGQLVFIESTAEGQEGHFYNLCEDAQVKHRQAADLTPLDFKFHFFPWWKEPQYSIDPEGVIITDAFAKYFRGLAEQGIALTDGQKAWYVKKAETQLGDMKREYPSTPAEAFEASVEGAYYADQMAMVDAEDRIGVFPHVPGYPVHTISDIGMDDTNSVWLFQVLPSRVRMIGYFEHTGTGMDGMLDELERRAEEHGYVYGIHNMPHDIRVREWTRGGMTRIEIMLQEVKARDLGSVRKVERAYVHDRINGTRRILAKVEFDQAGCAQGVKCLRNYRKEWDEDLGVFRDEPLHNWASHGADAFGGLAIIFTGLAAEPLKPEPKPLPTFQSMTFNDFVNSTPTYSEHV
ncbi:terminase [Rhizobium bangladeshense]|uniref:Terminase n=1 Tax=Rhizobium bangladeshense TaxID=1138189 RepID=A0ABS7LIM5_9HYPH|nr:terminase [Rhizobium bangladeshense]MBY3590603.1 terminase [Rhizobium bangladeshense]